MIARLTGLLPRPGIVASIAGTIVIALVTTQLLSIVLLLVLPDPEIRLYAAGELIDVSDRAVAALDRVPQAGRRAALSRLATLPGVELRAVTSAPPPARAADRVLPIVDRLRASVEARLGPRVSRVIAWPTPLQPLPRPLMVWVRIITSSTDTTHPATPFSEAELDAPLPGLFEIGIELKDQTWLVLAPEAVGNHPVSAQNAIPMLIGTGLIVALLSAWTSRRLLAPLAGLVAAVEGMGRARSPAPVPRQGLGEFSVIADALNDMQDRLMRFVGERTFMLAAISHDLRTPLTRMRLLAEYVPDAEQKRQLERDIGEMEQMIEATLSFTAHDAHPEPRQPTDLAALLISLCDGRVDQGDRACFSGPDHLTVSCQPVGMKRAISNIVDNAIKYGSAAHITLSPEGRYAQIVVRDEGPGIPPGQVDAAFAPFRRLEASRNRATGGVGLGLTIARDVIMAHGGNIEISTAAPRGALVRVTVPTG